MRAGFSKLIRLASSLAVDRRGNIALLFGLLVLPILIAAGVAIDLQRAGQVRAAVQEAADAALLRAARVRTGKPNATDAELTALARRIFNAATINTDGINITKFQIIYNPATDTFTLDVDGSLDTSVLGIAGVYITPIDTISEVKLGKPPFLEIVMALDNTGSMNQQGKLRDLKDSAKSLVEALFSNPDAVVKVGLVPFAQYVNVGTVNAGKSWMQTTPNAWMGCVGSRNYPDNLTDADYDTKPIPGITGANCPDAILPLTDAKDDIITALDGMDGNGYTYIPSGLVWGWRVLTAQEPFTGGATKAELAANDGIQALIVLTDGENTRAPTYPQHDSANQSLANDLMIRICDNIKDDGITVYSIAFSVTNSTVRDLLEQCATTPGHYFSPDTDDELASTFANIAASLRSISLSK